MSQFALDEQYCLHYRVLTSADNRATLAFCNALIGETAMWAKSIVPGLCARS